MNYALRASISSLRFQRVSSFDIMKTFAQLGLKPEILKALEKKGYTNPSPVQASAIPPILKGQDILAAAQTGTGKTAGFVLPILDQLSDKPARKNPRALIVTPTRELAAQILDNINVYSEFLSIKSTVTFGGVNIKPQIRALAAGVDILVTTPGRLLDLVEQGACKLHEIETLVLDEADRMLDMGFIRDIRKIVKMIPAKRQNLLFSATFSKDIRRVSQEFLNDPALVEVAPENATADKVEQRAYRCDSGSKTKALIELFEKENLSQVIVFTRTKHGANRLSKNLDEAGINSAAIHGNKSQGARTKALASFKEQKIKALIATDIAARGIDIDSLPYVINFELPNQPEDYVHRIGRTARAGKEGTAISLVANDERPFFTAIEKLTGNKIPLNDLEGFEPQNWPDRAPTAKEVMKAAEQRKQEARKARGGGGNGGGGRRGGGGGRRGGNSNSSSDNSSRRRSSGRR